VLGSQLFVGFDAGSLTGALVSSGLRGPRLRAYVRVNLGPGALEPGALEPNLVRADEVRDALSRVRADLGTSAGRATLVLPDGVARTRLLGLEGDLEPRELARFKLARELPYPENEAVVDGLRLGRGHFLAAAARRGVLAEYESAAAEAGFRQERLDLAPLAGLAGLSRSRSGETVDVLLGDVALCVIAYGGGQPRAFRNRRRATGPGEADWLAAEIGRIAKLGGLVAHRVRLVGSSARELARRLADRGVPAEAGWSTATGGDDIDMAESSWLGGVL